MIIYLIFVKYKKLRIQIKLYEITNSTAMKKLLFILLLLTACKSPVSSDCNTIEATYTQFISYQDYFAHRFQTDSNLYFYYKEFNGTIGAKYKLCTDGMTVVSILD